ncbi:ORC ubiquitin ligase 1 isoform 2-T2 [Pholidichthys leucotaenia]
MEDANWLVRPQQETLLCDGCHRWQHHVCRTGGTNEGDTDDPSMRKCLRKTRGELLLREYEDEIERLMRENGELKIKNQSLEEKLKTTLDPCGCNTVQQDERIIPTFVLEEWTSKRRAGTDGYAKLKQDLDRLKEANKALRSQNRDLVQENMTLKAEVASRSPQKFGRYTVAALEAKIQQYEREVGHLKRALERIDQYVEELECRVSQSDKRCLELQEACASSMPATDVLTRQKEINMMSSESNNERKSVCNNPESECPTFSRNRNLTLLPSADDKDITKNPTGGRKVKDLETTSPEFLPATPSTAFQSLTLRSPCIYEKEVSFKPASSLKRLNFEGFSSSNKPIMDTTTILVNQLKSFEKFCKGLPSNNEEPSKSSIWGGWSLSRTDDESCRGPRKEASVKETPSTDFAGSGPDSFQMSSEASMDAAYLDKISELDSMMLDGESMSSPESSTSSLLAAALDNTVGLELETCTDILSSPGGKPVVQSEHHPSQPSEDVYGVSKEKEGSAALVSGGKSGSLVPSCVGREGPSQSEELSFDLLFDPLDESKAGPSGSLSPTSEDHDPDKVTSSSSSTSISCTSRKPVNTTRDRLNPSQPLKRKSLSPCNAGSTTKVSKLE